MKIILIRNFAPDRQHSMLKFADCMAHGLRNVGEDVEVLSPRLRVGRLFGSYHYHGLSKWLGYFDKFIVFPRTLHRRLELLKQTGEAALVHVLDHGNALYVPTKSSFPWLVTCNDLLAVKAARGMGQDVQVSGTGRFLQKNIVQGLKRADHVACVSTATRADLLELLPTCDRTSSVIWMGLNHPYQAKDPEEMQARRERQFTRGEWRTNAPHNQSAPPSAYVLHVGSDHPRKNRPTVLQVVAQAVGNGWPGDLVLAGQSPGPSLLKKAAALGLTERLWWIENPGNDDLEALYNGAKALLFPSFAEGFGWPVIEAQACRCPVITSTTTSLPEVAGAGSLRFAPRDIFGMANALQKLEHPDQRSAVVDAGLHNIQRFSLPQMIDRYRSLYATLPHRHST